MEVLSILLITAILIIVVLFSQLSYKNHCIEDLENRLCKESERKNKDFVSLLKELKKYQDFAPVERDYHTRKLLNESIQEYTNENWAFEKVIEEASKIYVKKELNNNATNDNV